MIVGRWLWRDTSRSARVVRLTFLPLSALYGVVMGLREAAFRMGVRSRRSPVLPTVAVGNLTVGGSGKTPLAQWMARWMCDRRFRPAIVLRPYGGDEVMEHRRAVPEAVVLEDADRHAAIAVAANRGADVAILDDAFQRLDVLPRLTVAAVSVESSRGVRWLLPAGPWRERWKALSRADLVIVTRKRAERAVADEVAAAVRAVNRRAAIAQVVFSVDEFFQLRSEHAVGVEVVAGKRVVAVAGIADPDSFAAQLEALGASVTLVALPDHAEYGEREMALVLRSRAEGDYVVLTQKDAVKLRDRWPNGIPEPLVARMRLTWEAGADLVEQALSAVVSDVAGIASAFADERG